MPSFRVGNSLKTLQLKFKNIRNLTEKETARPVIVGFTANYALYVHERVAMKWKGLPRGHGFTRDKDGIVRVPMSMLKGDGKTSKRDRGFYWDPQGQAQAKFLEEPARTKMREIGRVILQVAKQTGSIQQALLAGGMRLQREAMLLVPVETGNLKNSAFTRLE